MLLKTMHGYMVCNRGFWTRLFDRFRTNVRCRWSCYGFFPVTFTAAEMLRHDADWRVRGRTTHYTTSLTTAQAIDGAHAANLRSENTHSGSRRSRDVVEHHTFLGLLRDIQDEILKGRCEFVQIVRWRGDGTQVRSPPRRLR